MVHLPDIFVYGASRQGSVVIGVLQAQGYRVLGFIDDNPRLYDSSFKGLPVYPGSDWIQNHSRPDRSVIVAIGNNDVRVRIGQRLRASGLRLVNAIHPSAVLMQDVRLGSGVLICAGAVVITGTTLQDDTVINTGATVDHDSVIEQGAYLAPGVHTAGCVTIRKCAFVGSGTVIGPGVVIGEGSIVGAGSLVLQDVPPQMLAYGSPAKPVRALSGPVDWHQILSGKQKSDM